MATTYRDPAERSGYLRLFYRDWRPTRLGRLVNGAWARLSGLGLTPRVLLALQVRGWRSGRNAPVSEFDAVAERYPVFRIDPA
jgi:hypothetical protein